MSDVDDTLINRVLKGSQSAFAELVKNNQKLVYHIVSKIVPEAEREDICQDVFLKVYSNLAGFQRQSKLSTWIGRIAYNRCLNYLEKKKVTLYEDISGEDQTIDSLPLAQSGPDEKAETSDIGAKVRAEIDRLPVKYGTILALFHLEDMTYEEIGQVMGLPDGTVKSYLFRARKMLREQLLARYEIEDLCL